MLNDLIVERDPPKNRQGKCDDPKERHLTEAAVMLAYGMHLFQTVPGLSTVDLHLDCEKAKRLDIPGWLSARGFVHRERRGGTSFGGTYVRDALTVLVDHKPGFGDVAARLEGIAIVAECKGGS